MQETKSTSDIMFDMINMAEFSPKPNPFQKHRWILLYRQRTPLHWSAGAGHVDVSILLISSKADVDARDNGYVW